MAAKILHEKSTGGHKQTVTEFDICFFLTSSKYTIDSVSLKERCRYIYRKTTDGILEVIKQASSRMDSTPHIE